MREPERLGDEEAGRAGVRVAEAGFAGARRAGLATDFALGLLLGLVLATIGFSPC